MAIKTNADSVQSFNGSFPLPRDRYLIRCVKDDFGISKSSGNPMLTRSWEIVGMASDGGSTDVINVEGKSLSVAGIGLKPQYLSLSNKDADKAKKAIGRFFEEQAKLGLESTQVDDENPFSIENTSADGKVAWAIVSCERQVATKEATEEEKAAGKYIGEEIKDEDGKSIVRYVPKIDQILKAAEII